MNNYQAVLNKINLAYVLRNAKKMTSKDIKKVIAKIGKIVAKVNDAEPLKKFVDDVRVMFEMLKDYYNGTYREVPFGSICAVTFALLYVLLPVDLIPDFIPIIGYLDDAAVVYICLNFVKQDLDQYRSWKYSAGNASATTA